MKIKAILFPAFFALIISCTSLDSGVFFPESEDHSVQEELLEIQDNRLRAAHLAASMDIRTLSAQVLLAAVDGIRTVPERTRVLLREVPAGGIILFESNVDPDPERNRIFINELSLAISAASIFPFIATDQEGGTVQRFRGNAALPSPISYWRRLSAFNSQSNTWHEAERIILSEIERDAAVSGHELRRMGVTMNLAPVVEITRDNGSFIRNRIYGPVPDFAAQAAGSFIRGMESAGVAATLKHFPGHSALDPHYNRSFLNVCETELEEMIKPFEELIRSVNPSAVMLSHAVVPVWGAVPASQSSHAVNRLRGMGFDGIIMADDLIMTAAGDSVEAAAVRALAAGVDMIIVWPRDLRRVFQAILNALDTGTLCESRIREAAERIIYQKIRYGLITF